MKVLSRNYVLDPDGTHTLSFTQEEVNPADYQQHPIPGLPDVLLGIRLEEDGKVVIPEGEAPPPPQPRDAEHLKP